MVPLSLEVSETLTFYYFQQLLAKEIIFFVRLCYENSRAMAEFLSARIDLMDKLISKINIENIIYIK